MKFDNQIDRNSWSHRIENCQEERLTAYLAYLKSLFIVCIFPTLFDLIQAFSSTHILLFPNPYQLHSCSIVFIWSNCSLSHIRAPDCFLLLWFWMFITTCSIFNLFRKIQRIFHLKYRLSIRTLRCCRCCCCCGMFLFRKVLIVT